MQVQEALCISKWNVERVAKLLLEVSRIWKPYVALVLLTGAVLKSLFESNTAKLEWDTTFWTELVRKEVVISPCSNLPFVVVEAIPVWFVQYKWVWRMWQLVWSPGVQFAFKLKYFKYVSQSRMYTRLKRECKETSSRHDDGNWSTTPIVMAS